MKRSVIISMAALAVVAAACTSAASPSEAPATWSGHRRPDRGSCHHGAGSEALR